jgi:Zn-dependent protease
VGRFCSFILDLKLDLKVEAFLHAACADLHARAVRDARPLKIRVLTAIAGRIELGSTNRVGVLTNHFRSFCAEGTDVCHRIIVSRCIVPWKNPFCNPICFSWYTEAMLENPELITILFTFCVVIFSIILHEVAHGYAAYIQGDETAHRAGRLTLNPVPHIDILGSVIVPSVAFLTAGTFFGWAKPVPYNVHNIRTRIGHAFVAAAGVLTNLLIALLTGIAFKMLAVQGILTPEIGQALFLIIMVNVSLAFFNLIPVPPFDGMAILQAFFPRLHIRSEFVYSPIYLIGAILIASVLYGMFMPPVLSFVWTLLV